MKSVIIFLLVSFCFCNCNEKKASINFVALDAAEFNATRFESFRGKIADSLKHVHDSCMGFSFDANAFFLKTRDSLSIGSIVNRHSLKTVNTLNDMGVTLPGLISNFNVISKPCYEKRDLHFPVKSLLGENFILRFPNVNEALNKEINDAIMGAGDAEMQTGSWVYLDMKDALKIILDTTHSFAALRYRDNILDTSNMALITAESVTDVSFIIATKKDMSEALQAFLRSKPAAPRLNSQASLNLYYITGNKFEMTLNGFFPVVGEFMKAELK